MFLSEVITATFIIASVFFDTAEVNMKITIILKDYKVVL